VAEPYRSAQVPVHPHTPAGNAAEPAVSPHTAAVFAQLVEFRGCPMALFRRVPGTPDPVRASGGARRAVRVAAARRTACGPGEPGAAELRSPVRPDRHVRCRCRRGR
jgi:hypothetical protein